MIGPNDLVFAGSLVLQQRLFAGRQVDTGTGYDNHLPRAVQIWVNPLDIGELVEIRGRSRHSAAEENEQHQDWQGSHIRPSAARAVVTSLTCPVSRILPSGSCQKLVASATAKAEGKF